MIPVPTKTPISTAPLEVGVCYGSSHVDSYTMSPQFPWSLSQKGMLTAQFVMPQFSGPCLPAIFIGPWEGKERVRLSKEIFLVQLVGTKLHGGVFLHKPPSHVSVSLMYYNFQPTSHYIFLFQCPLQLINQCTLFVDSSSSSAFSS